MILLDRLLYFAICSDLSTLVEVFVDRLVLDVAENESGLGDFEVRRTLVGDSLGLVLDLMPAGSRPLIPEAAIQARSDPCARSYLRWRLAQGQKIAVEAVFVGGNQSYDSWHLQAFLNSSPRTTSPMRDLILGDDYLLIMPPLGAGTRTIAQNFRRSGPLRDSSTANPNVVDNIVTFLLTLVPISDTHITNLAQLQDGRRVTPAAGASAVPAGGGSSLPFSGGSGKTPGRHHDRSARSSLDWDRPASDNAWSSRVPGSAFWS